MSSDREYSYESIANQSNSEYLSHVEIYPRTEEVTCSIEKSSEKYHYSKYPHPHISNESFWQSNTPLESIEEARYQECRYTVYDREWECRILKRHDTIYIGILDRYHTLHNDTVELSAKEYADISDTCCNEKSRNDAIPIFSSISSLGQCLIQK